MHIFAVSQNCIHFAPLCYNTGDIISSIEAVNPNLTEYFDIRPKVFDNETKKWILLDSGSCVSCYPAGPSDVLNPQIKLKSVNGGNIDTYGTKVMTLKIGRKSYHINAVIAAVPSPIFGWDVFKKYHLSLDWNEFGDLMVVDKKANISSVLKHEVNEQDSVPRIQEITRIKSDKWAQVYFEAQCMKRLDKFVNAITLDDNFESPYVETSLPLSKEADPDVDKDERANLIALNKLEPKYASLIKKYPDILKNSFKTTPKHQVFHTIDTGNEKPSTSKVPPLLADSEKSKQGKII